MGIILQNISDWLFCGTLMIGPLKCLSMRYLYAKVNSDEHTYNVSILDYKKYRIAREHLFQMLDFM